MISLPDFPSLQAALSLPLDPTLHRLLAERIADAVACGVEHMTHILVVEPGDGEGDLLREAAFSPFYNPISDTRFGSPDFEPHWDWCGRPADGWLEWLTVIGNDGYAILVLVSDIEGVNPELRIMLNKAIDESKAASDMARVRKSF